MTIKYNLLFFVFMLQINLILAQKPTKQSFEQDTLLLQELFSESEKMLHRNFDSCLLMGQEILELCQTNLEVNLEDGERAFFLSRKGDAYKYIGMCLAKKGDLDGAMINFKKLLILRKKENKRTFLANAYNNIGVVYGQQGAIDSALLYYNKGLEISKEIDDKRGIIAGLLNTSNLLTNKGKLTAALGNFQQTLTLSKELKDSFLIINTLFSMARIYNAEDAYVKARRHYEEALVYCEATNYESGKGIGLGGIGLTYAIEGKDDLAKDFLKKGLGFSRNTGYLPLSIRCLLSLGDVARKEKDNDLALAYYKEALDFSEKIGGKETELIALKGIGIIAFEQGKLEEALMNGERALAIAQKVEHLDYVNEVSKLLANIYTEKGNYKKGVEMLELYISTKDSLVNHEQSKKIIELTEAYKYDIKVAQDSIVNAKLQEEKDIELSLQKVKNTQQKQQSIFLFLSLLLMISFGIYIYRRYQVTTKQKEIIEAQKKQVDSALDEIKKRNEEKELLLKEIHHRVKNNLQIISSLLDLQSNKIEDDTARSVIADGQSRVKSMALIHHKLYQHENIATINIKEYIGQLFNQIMATLTATPPKLTLDIDAEVAFDIDTAIPLGLILNELLTNACKYAFEEGKQGELSIRLKEKEEGSYALEVKDNGNGMPSDFNLGKARSLGLRLVRRLSKQLLGKATYKNDNGACFCIEFKNTALRKTID
jgi:two-component sensor histidine kinase/Tfp pilus assembly protein PilF